MQQLPDKPLATREGVQKPNVVVQTTDVRIVEYVLAPGDNHPWHHHSAVADTFYCLEGLVGVETRQPAGKHVLGPGDKCQVPPSVVHHASNAGDGTSRYLLIQALGKYDYIRADG